MKLWLPRRKLTPRHYSSGDWDFEQTLSWGLDPQDFISAPSSLALSEVSINNPWVVLCRQADTQVIEQGRIVSWIRNGSSLTWPTDCLFFFRAQSPLGSPDRANSYAVWFRSDHTFWGYFDASGNWNDIALAGIPVGSNWIRVRITWWNGQNLSGQDATVLRTEYFYNGTWRPFNNDLYDTNQRWKGSTINRVGLGVQGSGSTPALYVWFDDTEIWCTA